MSGVFISYRREDSSGHAGRLYGDLREQFGDERVFIDIDRIGPGVDFVERIDEVVATADAVIAVIGPRWATAERADGHRRIDDPGDFVRLEIGAALDRGTRVIPALVDGASVPAPEELPEDLRHFTVEARYPDARSLLGAGEIWDVTSKLGRVEPPFQQGHSWGSYWARVHPADAWLESGAEIHDVLLGTIRRDVRALAESGIFAALPLEEESVDQGDADVDLAIDQ